MLYKLYYIIIIYSPRKHQINFIETTLNRSRARTTKVIDWKNLSKTFTTIK